MIEILGWLVVVAGVVMLAYAGITYKNLVDLNANVSKAWSNLAVLLNQRHDELPKFVEVCRQHLRGESGTLEKVLQTRARVNAAHQSGSAVVLGEAERELRVRLQQLIIGAGSYPALTANPTFCHLRDRINALGDSIADRARVYNHSVTVMNARLARFPAGVIGRQRGFVRGNLLEIDPGAAGGGAEMGSGSDS